MPDSRRGIGKCDSGRYFLQNMGGKMTANRLNFRGMDIKGNWHIGCLSILKETISHVETGYYISNSVRMPFAYQVRPETVGQSIGRCDKNGKEIFEGDIYKPYDEQASMGYPQVFFNQNTASWGEVAWNLSFTPFYKWRCDGSTDGGGVVSTEIYDLSRIEVIGNIYENPELLEGK